MNNRVNQAGTVLYQTQEIPAATRRFPWKTRFSVLSILVIGFLVASIDRIGMSVAIPYIAAELHLSPLQMGAVMSAFFFSYALAQIPGGLLADKFGVRRVATVALLWWSTFTALTGAITSLTQLIVTRFIFGLGEGPYPGCAFKTVAQWFPKRERATASSIMLAATLLGAALAPLLVVGIIALWGWREVFFVLFVPGVIVASLFWRFIPDRPSESRSLSAAERAEIEEDPQEASAEPARASEGLTAILLNPSVIRYFLIYIMFDLTYWGFSSWLPAYLVQARGYSMVEMGAYAALPAFAGTVGCVLAGWMSDRFFRDSRRLPIVAAELLAALFLYLTFAATSTAALVAFQTIGGFCLMFFFGVFWALPMNTVPARNMGVTGAFINMAGQLAAVIAPLVIGYLVDVSGGRFELTFAFLIACLLVSSLLVLTIPKQSSTRRN